MPYVSAVALSGPPEAAIRVVRDALIANAFTIGSVSPTEFTATGPGLMSSNQNPLLGVSGVSFRAEDGALHVQTELGGATRLGLFAIFFPLGLGLALAGVLRVANKPNAFIAPMLAVAPWLVLGPLIAFFIRKRTQKAINALLLSAASISGTG